ncbi:MAG: ATP-binding protein [Pseudoalteromonas spongiae]|uniref:sensor histidine kinase n=1 Tax=Pseudoalteromonas spongiae TaxID=298657 RepID=UPI00026CDED8|nr:HAMP domain-containing sensor histidine kinase [Pseudoalteromonas spongiae]ATD00036.1 two-component system, OmpR family, heavy metal sensor histidine kinase CusS [Pseudoalteromonas spongiae UST010723-006]TMO83913.1 sensor histidine kinase [Pseudoalteromonas spongiae]
MEKQLNHLPYQIQSRLTHKLLIALVIISLFSSAMAGLYFDSSNRFKDNAQKSELVHKILNQYSNIALYTFEKLVAIGEMSRNGIVLAPELREENEQKLRTAIVEVRNSLLKKVALAPEVSTQNELALLDRVTQKVERIITTSQEIRSLITRGELSEAQSLYRLLQQQGVHAEFNALISEAVKQENLQAEAIRDNSKIMSERNNRYLAIALGLLSLFMMLTIWFFWQRISKATKQLQFAASQFTAGKLEHRIPKLKDTEFAKLADALNFMASELKTKQTELGEAKLQLEEKVQERTKALALSNEKLAYVDKQRRQFLADISHELRTPLTIIRGESEILLRSHSENVDDYLETLVAVVDQVSHTTALIDDLMLVARSSAGELRLSCSEVNLSKLIQDLCYVYRRKAQERKQDIVFDISEEISLELDERRIRQVLMILLENALSYSTEHAITEVKVLCRQQVVIIKIIDAGQGVTKQELENIFERFYRSNRSNTPGSGLGLPVAKAIVDAHGGHISLKSNASGVGSVATILLPLNGEERNENFIS